MRRGELGAYPIRCGGLSAAMPGAKKSAPPYGPPALSLHGVRAGKGGGDLFFLSPEGYNYKKFCIFAL